MLNNPVSPATRREFLKTAAVSGAAFGATALGVERLAATAVTSVQGSSETLVKQLYGTLTEQQKSVMAFPFGHPLQSKVDANWYITPARVGSGFSADQRQLIFDIFRGLHNPDFVDEVMRHVKEDAGGLEDSSIAVFGEPGAGGFEFVLSGRHCTVRCDGDSVAGTAFGGPIFYGHASGSFNEPADHAGNVYWYQAKRANEVFQALDGKQRAAALLGDPRKEQKSDTVNLKTSTKELEGLPVAEMSRDQRGLVGKVLADLLLPFREADRDEAMRHIKANGGVESLSMAFYKNLDIGNDGVWDVWQLESPKMVWYFRGSPHVHTWVNIRA